MPIQVFTDQELDLMSQAISTIAQSRTLISNQLNMTGPQKVASAAAKVQTQINANQSLLDNISITYTALQSTESARLTALIATLNALLIKINNLPT